MTSRKRTLRSERGQSLVEFALVIPLFLAVAFIITEFGRAFWTQNILTAAAGNGARMAIASNDVDYQTVAAKGANDFLKANHMETGTTVETQLDGTTRNISVTITRQFDFIPGDANKQGLPTHPGATDNSIKPGNGTWSITLTGRAVMNAYF